jgi:hypothetical protein
MTGSAAGRWPARSDRLQVQGIVSRGLFGMAFVRHPEWLPANLTIKPLLDKLVEGDAIVETVAACIVTADAAGARRFAEALSGLPEEQQAYAGIADQARSCVQPWPDVAINGPMLRAGLGIALFRATAAARLVQGSAGAIGSSTP